jgi:hypothetical protein
VTEDEEMAEFHQYNRPAGYLACVACVPDNVPEVTGGDIAVILMNGLHAVYVDGTVVTVDSHDLVAHVVLAAEGCMEWYRGRNLAIRGGDRRNPLHVHCCRHLGEASERIEREEQQATLAAMESQFAADTEDLGTE